MQRRKNDKRKRETNRIETVKKSGVSKGRYKLKQTAQCGIPRLKYLYF